MRTQCKLLGIARSSLDYVPVAQSTEDNRLKRLLDEIYMLDPSVGSRRLVTVLERDHGLVINCKRIQRLKREMGLETIYCKPRTSIADKSHPIYPYLLRDKEISRPDEVWCADITYVPMARGHAHQMCFNAGGGLLKSDAGVSAGSADKAAAFPMGWWPWDHVNADVKPFIWALQLDGTPADQQTTALSAPIMHEGANLKKYSECRPAIANSKPILTDGATP